MTTAAPSARLYDLEITAADVVLDVGSGGGNDCLLAGGVGAEVIALDVEAHALEHLARRMAATPARGFRAVACDLDAGPIPLPDGVATVVLAKEVMEHLEAPERFLAELARLGRPGARYLLTVPDPASESLLRLVAPDYYWEKPCHINVFERDRLDALVAGAGLRVTSRHCCGFYDSLWWLFRMAVGTEYFPGHPHFDGPPPILRDWESTWRALLATPRGAEVARLLDRMIPRSQVVVAEKPSRAA